MGGWGDRKHREDDEALAPMHRAIATVEHDIEDLHYHTALAALMSYTNWLAEARSSLTGQQWRRGVRTLLLLLAPLAPHITEELWERLGEPYSIHQQRWPQYEARYLEEKTVTLVVQVNGRVRDRIQAPAGLRAEQARELALGSEKVARLLDGRQVVDVVYVPDRVVNLVTV